MVKVIQILPVFIVLLILKNVENRKKLRTIYFLDSKIDMNPTYCKYMQFNISPDKTSMNILMETQVNITQLWATAGISVWQKSPQAFRSIATYDIDLCETLQRLKSAKMDVLNRWVLNVLKYGNISANCPFLKNVYYLDDMRVDKNSIPDFAPSGKFQTSFILYSKEDNGLKVIIGNMSFILQLK